MLLFSKQWKCDFEKNDVSSFVLQCPILPLVKSLLKPSSTLGQGESVDERGKTRQTNQQQLTYRCLEHDLSSTLLLVINQWGQVGAPTAKHGTPW